MSQGIPVLRRTHAYSLIVGVVAGILVAGLAIPILFGDTVSTTSAAGGDNGTDLESLGADTDAGGTGGTTDGGTDGLTGGTTGDGSSGAGAPGGTPSAGGGTRSTVPGGAPRTSSTGQLAASDRGVTPDTIRLGITVLDIATVGRLGVAVAIDPEQQMHAYQTFVDEINERGGIHGRKIQAFYRAFDVTSRDDEIAACRELTQEKQVFAVLGGFNIVDPNLCVVEENQTPLISSQMNNPDWVFQRAGGRLVTLYPGSGRMMSSLVAELQRTNLLGKKIGILTDGLNDPGARVADQLKGMIEGKGGKVVYRGLLSDDIPTASSQTPVEVNRMQTAGAELVIFLNSNAVYGTQFVNQASRQSYRPIYANSDWASNAGDTTNNNMPEAYEGAVAFTFSRSYFNKQPTKPNATAERCRQIYDDHSEEKLDPPGPGPFGTTMSACDLVRIFEMLATSVGPNLTRSALTGALRTFPGYESAASSPGSFGGKPEYADFVRTERWGFDCKCWHQVDGFHRPGG